MSIFAWIVLIAQHSVGDRLRGVVALELLHRVRDTQARQFPCLEAFKSCALSSSVALANHDVRHRFGQMTIRVAAISSWNRDVPVFLGQFRHAGVQSWQFLHAAVADTS